MRRNILRRKSEKKETFVMADSFPGINVFSPLRNLLILFAKENSMAWNTATECPSDSRCSLRRASCVDLPDPSMPVKVMNFMVSLVHDNGNRLEAGDGDGDAVFADTCDDIVGLLVVCGVLLDNL